MSAEMVAREFTHPDVVKIKSGDSYIIINKSDFDPDEHELYDESDGSKMTVAEIKAKLDELGIEYPASAKKAELEKLLIEAE